MSKNLKENTKYNMTKEILQVYLQSKEHEDFLKENGTMEKVYNYADELSKRFSEDWEGQDDINDSLIAVYNIGEDSGIMQGIQLAIRFIFEHIQVTA